MEGVTCTSETCPCRNVRDEGPAIGSLINRQQDTDAIVFPLFAGTLARCVLATRPSTPPSSIDALMGTGLVDHARIILTLAERVSDADGWERDRDAFATVVNFVLAAWEVFRRWVPTHYVPIAGQWDGASPGTLVGAARDWMRPDRERTLTELVLFTADVANRVASNKPVLPLESKAVRPLRVEIAARLRARGLTTWPRVLEAAVADWNTAALERLMLDFAFDPLAISRDVLSSLGVDVDAPNDSFDADMDDDDPWDEPAPQPVATVPDAPPSRDPGLESMLTDALAEIDRGEARRQAIEGERLKLADRCAGLQGRIERLTSDLSASRAETAEMEALVAALRRERDELADRLVAEEVLTGARPAPPADALPAAGSACSWVGRRGRCVTSSRRAVRR